VPSIKEVAKAAGVSIATVSRVVTNAAFVQQETKNRVQKAMQELNYVPNLLAKGLKNKSGGFIGLVVREYSREFFTSMIHDFEEFVSVRGFTLLLSFIKGRDPRSETDIIRKLVGRHVDGIILLSPFGDEESLKSIRITEVPIVFFGCYHDVSDIHRIALDEYEAGKLAAAHLAGLGHRKLFCVTGPEGHYISRTRLKGFRDSLCLHGIDLPDSHVYYGDFEFASGKATAALLARRGLGVTGVWFQNDLMALGALGELERLGVEVPGDMSIVGMDNIAQTEFSFPRLTTINQPIREMTKRAVDMLLCIPKGGVGVDKDIVFLPELIERDSTSRVV
jgi:DNA-binding LacI/PurR family transcriptional regulator